MRLCRTLAAPLLLALAGCGSSGAGDTALAVAEPPPSLSPDWRRIATPDDRHRLREWRTAWVRGIRQARVAGHGGELDREGILLNPDAAALWRDPPPGDYRCRIIKIGAKTQGLLDYIAYPQFACRIGDEAGLMSFTKLTGSQRQIGMILPYFGQRMVFLGTLQLGDERRTLEYGRDRERDVAGVIEHLPDGRWRMVFPYPHFESTVDVMELVPA